MAKKKPNVFCKNVCQERKKKKKKKKKKKLKHCILQKGVVGRGGGGVIKTQVSIANGNRLVAMGKATV